MTQAQWNACIALDEQVPAFSGLIKDLSAREEEWREYINSPEPRILLSFNSFFLLFFLLFVSLMKGRIVSLAW